MSHIRPLPAPLPHTNKAMYSSPSKLWMVAAIVQLKAKQAIAKAFLFMQVLHLIHKHSNNRFLVFSVFGFNFGTSNVLKREVRSNEINLKRMH